MALIVVAWGLTVASAAVWFQRWWVLIPAVLMVAFGLLVDEE